MGKSGECLAFCVLPHLTTIALSQVVRDDGLLRGVQQGDPCLRDGDAGADQRLPPGVLRLPAVQPQVRDYLRVGDRPFPITSINCRTPKGTPSLPPSSELTQHATFSSDIGREKEREREREGRNSDELNTCR